MSSKLNAPPFDPDATPLEFQMFITDQKYAEFVPPSNDILNTVFGLAQNLHCLGVYHRYLALDVNYGPGNKTLVDGTNTGGNINNVFYPALMHLVKLSKAKKNKHKQYVFTKNDDNNMYHANLLCAIAERKLGVQNI